MFYDFHIHSCLSPCASEDMTPNNIVQMANIKGLNWIAVCDHNSTKQQAAIAEAAKDSDVHVLYGVEIQTSEEVHICCYFLELEDCENFQKWIESKSVKIKNKEQFFGRQLLMNGQDECIGIEEMLLITSLSATLNECCENVHACRGKVVLAHVLDRVNSITHQLGFIPKDCQFDGIEIKELSQMSTVLSKHPWIIKTMWFINSDAHQLIDISEAEHAMSTKEFNEFWGIDI